MGTLEIFALITTKWVKINDIRLARIVQDKLEISHFQGHVRRVGPCIWRFLTWVQRPHVVWLLYDVPSPHYTHKLHGVIQQFNIRGGCNGERKGFPRSENKYFSNVLSFLHPCPSWQWLVWRVAKSYWLPWKAIRHNWLWGIVHLVGGSPVKQVEPMGG